VDKRQIAAQVAPALGRPVERRPIHLVAGGHQSLADRFPDPAALIRTVEQDERSFRAHSCPAGTGRIVAWRRRMKIRIGVSLGAAGASDSDGFAGAVQHMERRGFDSLWLSEVLTNPVLDPLAGLAFAAGVTTKLKLGTTMTVTGRNPVRMAKELATIDRLSR